MSLFDTENNDFKVVKGSTKNLEFEFTDRENADVDITGYEATFTLRDPITNEVLITKTHDETAGSGGDGIYFNGDGEAPAGLGITDDNQLVVVLSYFDTNIDEGVYPFDIEFTIGSTTKETPVKGFLIVSKEITKSVP